MSDLRLRLRERCKNHGFIAVAVILLALGSCTAGLAQDVLRPGGRAQAAATNGSTPKKPGSSKPAEPLPALPGLLSLFDSYQVVALSDLHGCAELLAFLEQLLQTPDFARKVNDMTWEP